jgi:hypothetical protein
MAAIMVLTLLGIRAAGRGPGRRQPSPPTDLSATLSNVELFSTDEALRRMAEAESAPGQNPAKEPPP